MKRPHRLAFYLIFLSFAAPAAAQESAPENALRQEAPPAEVMILGTYHFEGAPEFNDMMAPQQQEIRAVLDSLAQFQPTKIAVEEVTGEAERLDSLYQAYRSGRHRLTRNERQQLGFRLAARFDHERIYAIDYKAPWPNQKAVAWARQHRPSFLTYYDDWRKKRGAKDDSLHQNASVGEILRHLNAPQSLRELEELRMRKLELGTGSKYPGVAPVESMYERDLRIFANLTRVTEPGDRIIVIYGSGHVHHLRDFVRNHPGMRPINPLGYL